LIPLGYDIRSLLDPDLLEASEKGSQFLSRSYAFQNEQRIIIQGTHTHSLPLLIFELVSKQFLLILRFI